MGFLVSDLITTGVNPESKDVFKRENIGFAFGASVCVCAQWRVMTLCMTHGLYPHPGPSVHGTFMARIMEWVAISLLQDLVRDQTQSPLLAVDSFYH